MPYTITIGRHLGLKRVEEHKHYNILKEEKILPRINILDHNIK